MIDCLPTQALAFLAVFVYATHATQAIAFEWKPGFTLQNYRPVLPSWHSLRRGAIPQRCIGYHGIKRDY